MERPSRLSSTGESSSPHEPRWRLLSWSVGVGLLLLSVSAIIVSLTVHSHSRAAGPSNGKSEGRAVAVAYVDVKDGVVSLYPEQLGQVMAVPVAEGEEVEKGTPLLQMDDTLAKAQLAEAEISLASASKRLQQAKRLLIQHDEQVNAQKALIQLASTKKAAARIQWQKAQRFHNDRLGGVSAEDVAAAKKLVDQAEDGIRAEQAKLKALETMKPDMAIELAELDVKAKEQVLVKAKHVVSQCTVRAPSKGKLLRRQVNVGEVLGANPRHPILLFCPVGERIVRAEVEQEFASQVSLRQKVRIVDDSTGGGEWRGQVMRISDWYTQRRSVLLEPLQFNDVRTLEVIIHVDQSSGKQPLRIGQRVRVEMEGGN